MSDILNRLEMSAQRAANNDTGGTDVIAETPFEHTRPIPPLHKWYPKDCGSMDLVIRASGDWYHEGTLMTRKKLVDLFSSVLWAELDGETLSYFLKTPVEKVQIQVEDAPLLITEVDQLEYRGQTHLQFKTAHGDVVVASQTNPVFMREYQGEMRPYIEVRDSLVGLIHRNVFFHLVNLGKMQGEGDAATLIIDSGDARFELQSAQ